MGVKCILLYKLPKGVFPTKEDVDRIVNALTVQLYCVPEASGRALKDGQPEKVLEVQMTVFKQQQATDPSLIKSPQSLKDVWLFKLHKEAPSKAYLLLKHIDSSQAYRVTEAEPSIRTFFEKRLDYRARGSIFVQSQAWHMGDKGSDVTIKLLSLLQQSSQTAKVLGLEVTYHPACLLEAACHVLQELSDRIIQAVGPASGSTPGQAGTLVQLQPKYHTPPQLQPGSFPPEGPQLFGPPHLVELYTEFIQEGLAARQ